MKPEFCAQCDYHRCPQYSEYGACAHPDFICMRDFAWEEFENEMWTDSDTQFPNWCPLKDVEGDD